MHNVYYLVLRRLRTPLVVLISVYAISILGFVLIPGTDPEGQPWRMDFFHAFYFVSYMGSTIGFGELPYPFNGAQRFWTLFSIYATVISWLYAIGTLISLIQNPLFQATATRNDFTDQVRKLSSPFYLVCGYGDTGLMLVQALADLGIQCVVIDSDRDRIDELQLTNMPLFVPGLNADASSTESLIRGGLVHPDCRGVVAVTREDEVNLKIAIASKLMNPDVRVFSAAQTRDTADNMASFGTDHIVNPHELFASLLSAALTSPSLHLLYQWLSSPAGTPLTDPIFPPNGRWILCGYGRFGKAIYRQLLAKGMPVTVVDDDPYLSNAPDGTVSGRGTEAVTLEAAELHKSVGIIAGSNHDVNNLSIILTARDLKPDLYTIARQEQSANLGMFQAARIDLVANHSTVIAKRLIALMTTPLTIAFLELASEQTREWRHVLVSRLVGCVDDTNPSPWIISVKPDRASAIVDRIMAGDQVLLHHLMRLPRDRNRKLPCVALLLQRGEEHILLPEDDTPLQIGDRILFAGEYSRKREIDLTCTSSDQLHYAMTGENRPTGYLWNWLHHRFSGTAANADSS